MVFVADEIPRELRRIVEFLNEQTDPAEVLALEVKQYVRDQQKVLVAHVIGRTEQAQQKKQVARKQRDIPWQEHELLDHIKRWEPPAHAQAVSRIMEWTRQQGLAAEGGRGATWPSINYVYQTDSVRLTPMYIYKSANENTLIHIWLSELRKSIPETQVVELCDRFNHIPGVQLDAAREYPSFRVAAIQDQQSHSTMMDALNHMMALLKAAV